MYGGPTPTPDPRVWTIVFLASNQTVMKRAAVVVLHVNGAFVAGAVLAGAAALLAVIWLHRKRLFV